MAETGIPPNIAQLTGPPLIGFAAQWALFGVGSVQVYLYYLNFPKDNWKMKTLVYGLYVLDALQAFLVTDFIFTSLASGWGNLQTLESIGISWFALPFLNAIISAAVECFYAWRIYTLSKSAILTLLVVSLALVNGCAGVAFSIIMRTRVQSFADLQSKTFAVTTTCLMGSASCDILISVSMLYLLQRARRSSGFSGTEKLLTRMINLVIGGGLLTTTVALLDAIFYLVYQNNNYHLAPNAALAKLYTNALMVLFNSRAPSRASANVNAPNYKWAGEESQQGSRSQISTLGTTFDRHTGITVDVNVNYALDPPLEMEDFDRSQSTRRSEKGLPPL
ncbi:hypothetical protein D9757_015052 [Collybiopsis confluens]|uniref:DUF6534 domain-containing protein n=1 Tax=Collybiopsis confluens TaxID=2823264 RepID=A0A8H5FF73_9AGAR|nr:hypothetical protein D9757_015052 [Collybiopsis confluens]